MTDTGDLLGGIIGAGISLAIIDRIHPSGRIRYVNKYARKRRKKKNEITKKNN